MSTVSSAAHQLEAAILSELAVILALILVNGVFAGAEIALVALRTTRLRELSEQGHGAARAALALRDEPERFLATVQVGITVVSATAAAFGGASIATRLTPLIAGVPLLAKYAHQIALGAVVACVSYLSIVIGELVPKSVALRAAEQYSLLIARPLLALSWLARPLVWLLTASSNVLLRPFGDKTTFTEARYSAEESTLGLDLPDDGEWNTIAGMCIALAGRIPVTGEKVTLSDGTVIEIVEASPKRVRTVRIHAPRRPEADAPHPGRS